MENHLLNFSSVISDIIDVLLVWFILYQVSFLFKNTRSTKIIIGSTTVGLLYITAQAFKLEGLAQVFQTINIVQIGSIVLVIIFAQEIKEALTSIGIKRVQHYETEDSKTIEAINQACLRMSANQVGALILIARRDNLNDLAKDAVQLNANVTSQMLETIFFEPTGASRGNNPLHDGATIISNNKIAAAKVICKQLSESIELSHEGKGTRHAAGLGFTEQSDCIAIIISHETGNISLAAHNESTKWNIDNADLLHHIRTALGLNIQKSSFFTDIKRWFLDRKIAKTISLSIAILIWLFSTSILTISTQIQPPNIYQVAHEWKEGDFVLNVDSSDETRDLSIELTNWTRIYFLLRPNNGGRYALQNAFDLDIKEEAIQSNWDDEKTKITAGLIVSNHFESYIKISSSAEYERISVNIQKLKKEELNNLMIFQLDHHPEIESIVGNSDRNILVPEKFQIRLPKVINMLNSDYIKPKNGIESWQDLMTLPKLIKNYPDFSGTLELEKLSEFKEIAKFNQNLEIKFRVAVRGTTQKIPESEEEKSATKELNAIKETIAKGVDSVMPPPGEFVSRQDVLLANEKHQKAIELVKKTEEQIQIYNKKSEEKNIEQKKIDADKKLPDIDEEKKQELQIKGFQCSKVQTIYVEILTEYKNNLPKLLEYQTETGKVFEEYKKAFQPVIKIYELASKVQKERTSLSAPVIPTLNFKNILDQNEKINSINFNNANDIETYLTLTTESLNTYLIEPLIPSKPGSIHEYKKSELDQYEKLDQKLTALNTHLKPLSKPAWMSLHKVETFKFCEEIFFQSKSLSILKSRISNENNYVHELKKHQNFLFNSINVKFGELTKKITPNERFEVALNLNPQDKEKIIATLKALSAKLDTLNKNVAKYIAEYEIEIKETPLKTKSLVFPHENNPILTETMKGISDLPQEYKDYTEKSEESKDISRNALEIKAIFNDLYREWPNVFSSLNQINKENSSELNKYLECIKGLQIFINDFSNKK